MSSPATASPSTSTTIIIGLSGPSSSGKTTLARLLRQIFNVSVTSDDDSTSSSIKLFILHEDDFYKTDKDIPLKQITSPPSLFTTRTLQDWDCIESLDLPLLSTTLRHIKSHGHLPPSLVSKEDQNTVGDSGVSDDIVDRFHSDIKSWVSSLPVPSPPSTSNPSAHTITICLLDGFLLYPNPSSPPNTLPHTLLTLMTETLDTKLFIPSTRAQTIKRRYARKGYVPMEGFWEDPEGYVEDVVWPNFGADHGWLFGGVGGGDSGGDGEMGEEVWKAIDEGRVDEDVARRYGVLVGPGSGEVHLREILGWAVERVREVVEGRVREDR